MCTFERIGWPALSLKLAPSLGLHVSGPPLDVTIVRVAAADAAGLATSQLAHVVTPSRDVPLGLALGSPLRVVGYCHGRKRTDLPASTAETPADTADTGGPAGILHYHAEGVFEKGMSGSPVFAADSGRVVAVHMGVDAVSGDGRATLVSAAWEAVGDPARLKAELHCSVLPPPYLRVAGRRHANDAINGIYALRTCHESMTADRHNGYPAWTLVVPPGGSGGGGEGIRPLHIYHGSEPGVWVIGLGLADGRLLSEGGEGEVLARRSTPDAADSDDPAEVCAGTIARAWHVMEKGSRPSAVLVPDLRVMLSSLTVAEFAEIQAAWRHDLQVSSERVARAPEILEACGFPAHLALINGRLEKRKAAWNRWPAWHRPSALGSQERPVFLYRDVSDTKWVVGLSLGDGHGRLAQVYTSLASPAEGFVWEIDCGDRWRPYLRATVREATVIDVRSATGASSSPLPGRLPSRAGSKARSHSADASSGVGRKGRLGGGVERAHDVAAPAADATNALVGQSRSLGLEGATPWLDEWLQWGEKFFSGGNGGSNCAAVTATSPVEVAIAPSDRVCPAAAGQQPNRSSPVARCRSEKDGKGMHGKQRKGLGPKRTAAHIERGNA